MATSTLFIRTLAIRLILTVCLALLLTLGMQSLALAQENSAYGWGHNDWGQLGDGTNVTRVTPVQIGDLTDVAQVSGGDHHTLILRSEGTVWASGWNGHGQLGDGTITSRNTLVQVTGLTDVKQIAGNGYHSLALKSDGTVWAWGFNYNGQLGDGTLTDRTTPVQVSGLTGVVQISAGNWFSLALKSDGTVWAWGSDLRCELGSGSWGGNRTVPGQVTRLTGVVQIAAGGWHSLAIRSDGTVWGWGYNESGQLGEQGTFDVTEPAWIPGMKGVVQVAAGAYHSLFLKSNGTVWGLGDNRHGQLGEGTTSSDRWVPVQAVDLTDVEQIACGDFHSLAMRSNGTVRTWGDNRFGQLGDGTTTNHSTPVSVSELTGVVQIAAMEYFSLCVTSTMQRTALTSLTPNQAYGTVTLTARLLSKNTGLPVPNSLLHFSMTGSPVGETFTDSNGVARLTLPDPRDVGKYTFTAEFAGNVDFGPSSTTALFVIVPARTQALVRRVITSIGAPIRLDAFLKRSHDGVFLPNQTLAFSVGGTPVGTAVTDENGLARLAYQVPESAGVGVEEIVVSYVGDSNLKAAQGTGTLTVGKSQTRLRSASVAGRAGETVALRVRLLRYSDASGLAGKSVRFRLDSQGIEGTAVTDADGYATWNWPIPVGTASGMYRVTITFEEETLYLGTENTGAAVVVIP